MAFCAGRCGEVKAWCVAMSEWFITVLLGVVEGITEFLPISSTGHLILIQELLGYERSEFFNVGIQAGAVLAVVLVYWKRLGGLALGWREPQQWRFLLKCAVAFGITVVLGLTVRKVGFTLEDSNAPAVIAALVIGAILIILAEKRLGKQEGREELSWPGAIAAGFAQVLAGVFPGTSRSAATIIAGMLAGSSRMAATEFSFILGIPTMFAASAYLMLEEMMDHGVPPAEEMTHFAVGFVVSLGVAFAAVKWLLHFIRSHTFIPFAIYRMGLGLLLAAWLLWAAQGT